MRHLLLFIIFLQNVNCLTQIEEKFSDGDFLFNPSWFGTDTKYVVNNDFQLQLSDGQSGSAFLSLTNDLQSFTEYEWKLWVKQNFSPSSNNYGRYYLLSDSSNLNASTTSYYVQLGAAGNNDAVELVKQTGSTEIVLLAGQSGAISASFEIQIQVVVDSTKTWKLRIDYADGSPHFEGTVQDSTFQLSPYTGWFCKYTASNANKFFIDDLYIGPKIYDTQAPKLEKVYYTSLKSWKLEFDEVLQADSLSTIQIDFLPALEVEARLSSDTLYLSSTQEFQNGISYQLLVSGITDLQGNSLILDTQLVFLLPEEPQKGDLLLTELMVDPTPSQGLPETEYMEILNTTDRFLSLKNVRIGDQLNGVFISDSFLAPKAYLVLVAEGYGNEFSNAIEISSFPSLTNSGDAVYLEHSGEVIDSIVYDLSYYQDNSKKEGGFSMERLYIQTACSDAMNWRASNAELGGTPGSQNSHFKGADLKAPNLLEKRLTEKRLELKFDESVVWIANLTSTIHVNFPAELDSVVGNKTSHLTFYYKDTFPHSQELKWNLSYLPDCNNNVTEIELHFLRGRTPHSSDLVINEFLFDPPTEGSDFVELVNVSEDVLNLKTCLIGREKGNDVFWSDSLEEEVLLFPGAYSLWTNNRVFVETFFENHNKSTMVQVDLPNFPNDSGTILLKCNQELLERIDYKEEWHYSLIEDTEGKSLERLSIHFPTNNSNNWATAAETSGYGTPGLANSQRMGELRDDQFFLSTPVVSPDNDGFEDNLVLSYNMPESGFVANIIVFDALGFPVYHWEQNTYLAREGLLKWEGVGDDGRALEIGQYVLWIEAFHPSSTQVLRKKLPVVVARRFQ